MYESWFHLNGRPFPSAPRVDCYFATEDSEQVRRSARQCVEFGTGPGLMIGALGTGKSLMTLVLKNDFLVSRPVAILRGSCIRTPHDLIQCLLHEFQRPIRHGSESEDRQALISFLAHGVIGRTPVVVLDEAERVSSDVLEEVQGLSQISLDGQWGLHLLLVGTESLEESLLLPSLRSLHQRIASRSRLYPFNRAATQAFIAHQMRRVAADQHALNVFSRECTGLIYELTGGVPRIVQQLCEHALILAAVAGKSTLTELAIHEAWNDLQQLPAMTPSPASQGKSAPVGSSNDAVAFIEFGSLEQAEPSQAQPTLPGSRQWFENVPDPSAACPVEVIVSRNLDRIEDDICMAFSEELSEQVHTSSHPGLPRELRHEQVDAGQSVIKMSSHWKLRAESERFAEEIKRPVDKGPPPQDPPDEQQADQNPMRYGGSVRVINPTPRRAEANPFSENFDEEIVVVTPDARDDRSLWRAIASVSTREGNALKALALPTGPRGVIQDEQETAVSEPPQPMPLEADQIDQRTEESNTPRSTLNVEFKSPVPITSTTAMPPKRPLRYRRLFSRLMKVRGAEVRRSEGAGE